VRPTGSQRPRERPPPPRDPRALGRCRLTTRPAVPTEPTVGHCVKSPACRSAIRSVRRTRTAASTPPRGRPGAGADVLRARARRARRQARRLLAPRTSAGCSRRRGRRRSQRPCEPPRPARHPAVAGCVSADIRPAIPTEPLGQRRDAAELSDLPTASRPAPATTSSIPASWRRPRSATGLSYGERVDPGLRDLAPVGDAELAAHGRPRLVDARDRRREAGTYGAVWRRGDARRFESASCTLLGICRGPSWRTSGCRPIAPRCR
jgi:hypothetical protein